MTTNVLNLSDEDLLKLDPSTLDTETPEQETTPTEEVVETTDVEEVNPEEGSDDEVVEQEQEQASGQDDPENQEAVEVVQGQEKSTPVDKQKPEGKPTKEEPSKDEVPQDFKKDLERILSPIKANGKEIQVSSVDDAIQLMQMGANYHKKMAALKPNLGILKMLEEHGVLDQAKLSFLIDLDKKNPDAIKKLIKDSGIDPLDIDTKNADDYKHGNYSIDEKAVDLDQVLDDLKGSTHYGEVLQLVGKQWDSKSRNTVADNPEIMRIIDMHMSTGIYSKIASVIDTERALGRLQGMSDLDAYRTVGDRMQANGEFNGLVQQATTPAIKTAAIKPVPKAEDTAATEKKRAASTTRANAQVKELPVNILNMSDEELANFDITKFATR